MGTILVVVPCSIRSVTYRGSTHARPWNTTDQAYPFKLCIIETIQGIQECFVRCVVDKGGLTLANPEHTLYRRLCRCGKMFLELYDICAER